MQYTGNIGRKIDWKELLEYYNWDYEGAKIIVKDLSYDEHFNPPSLGTQVFNVDVRECKCTSCGEITVTVNLNNDEYGIEFNNAGETMNHDCSKAFVADVYEFYKYA